MYLVLLDVNGVLGVKIPNNETNNTNNSYKTNNIDNIDNNSIIELKSYNFLLRHDMDKLYRELTSKYDVGIYSSTSYPNLARILSNYKFPFIADRSHTFYDPDSSSFETIKDLRNILDNPVFNPDRKWSYTNTVIVDNDYNKLRFNDSKNTLIVEEYALDNRYDCQILLDLIDEKISQL